MSDFPQIPAIEVSVEEQPYGARRDSFYADGKSHTTTEFNSATAAFTSADVGKTVYIPHDFFTQGSTRTIASVTNATTVVLSSALGSTEENLRFLISRGGDQTAAIQAAIDAMSARGGGVVRLPGQGYLITGLVMKDRVRLKGNGMHATVLHQLAASNKPAINNDDTLNNSASTTVIEDLGIDGNRGNQSPVTSTIATTAYVAGNSTLTVTSAAGFAPVGALFIGTNRLQYTSISGNVFQGVTGGRENTTDAGASIGATVTQYRGSGIRLSRQPLSSGGTFEDSYDPHHIVRNVEVNSVIGDGFEAWGQSETRFENCWGRYCDQFSFRPSWDTWLTNCTSDTSGRSGFYLYNTQQMLTGCKAFYSGGNSGSEGHGFMTDAFSQPAGCQMALSSCLAQDNKAHGFLLKNVDSVVLSACGADSNSVSSTGGFCGVALVGANKCIVDVICVERKADGTNSRQQNALSIDAASTDNIIRLTHQASQSATIGTVLKSGSVYTGNNNDISINGTPLNTAGISYKTADSTQTAIAAANVSELTFPVLANGTYRFKAFIIFQTSVTSTAARFAINGPTLTTLAAVSRKQVTAGGTASTAMFSDAILSAYDTPLPASTVEIAATTNLIHEIEGIVKASANGTVAVRLSKNVEAGTITIKAGSFIDFERLDVLNV